MIAAYYQNGYFNWDGILCPEITWCSLARARELAVFLAELGITPQWISTN